jgi:UDP-glucuronate 4-epimerase
MKILITGVAGFIGYHLAKTLLLTDNEIIGIDTLNDYYSTELKRARLTQIEPHKNFDFIKLDICDKTLLDRLFKTHKFDLVINFAAQAGVRHSLKEPYAYFNSNLLGFFNLLEACKNNNIKKFIYASSSSVYGNKEKTPFSESDATDTPISLYAATKKANEVLAHSYASLYNIKCIGLRFFTVYGPWGRPDMAYYSFTEKILNNEQISVFNNGNLLRDFTYIDDIINGITNLINAFDTINHPYKIYNLGNNKPVKLLDFISILEHHLERKALIKNVNMQQGDVYKTCADITAASNDFNYYPTTDLLKGLAHFTKWYCEYHKL